MLSHFHLFTLIFSPLLAYSAAALFLGFIESKKTTAMFNAR